MELLDTSVITWGSAVRACPGEAESGDRCLVSPLPLGALVAAVDGLGHGHEAAAAASKALGIIEANPRDDPALLVWRCHEALRATRGVAMSVARIDARTRMLTWLAVGNVSGWLLRGGETANPRWESLLVRSGVVGRTVPSLVESVIPIEPGETLVLATDGVAWRPFAESFEREAPQGTADRLLREYWVETDDALVLVARFRGDGR